MQAGVSPLAPQRLGPPEAAAALLGGVGRVSERVCQWPDGARLCLANADRWRAEGALRGRQDHPERLPEIQGELFTIACTAPYWASASLLLCARWHSRRVAG